MTDENYQYRPIGEEFKGGHKTVNHSGFEYARKADGAHINTAESSRTLRKGSVYRTFHHVSRKHLWRWLDEFDYPWNQRNTDDVERTQHAIQQSRSKRLMYREPAKHAQKKQKPPFGGFAPYAVA